MMLGRGNLVLMFNANVCTENLISLIVHLSMECKRQRWSPKVATWSRTLRIVF